MSGDAVSLLAEIEAATDNLAIELGVYLAEADYRLIQAYDRLEDILDRIHQLISRLNQIIGNLSDRYISQSQVNLRDTVLTLLASPASLFIGQYLTAGGRLTSDNEPLANRTVVINLDDNTFSVITDENGSFQTGIVIPYLYVPNMTLRASFSPIGEDIGVYIASQSLSVIINTLFYTTTLEASAPDSSRPGLSVVIEGQIYSPDSTQERTALILLDDRLIYEQEVNGFFNINLTIPDDIADGNHAISIIVSPEGRSSSARKDLPISISRLPIMLYIQIPSIVLLPNSIELSGRVSSLGEPVANAHIDIIFSKEQISTATDDQGYFSAIVNTSLDLSLMGPQQIAFYVTPVEPYYASLELEEWLFAINTANIGFIAFIFISLGIITFTRLKSKPAVKLSALVYSEVESSEPEADELPLRPKRSLSTARNEIYTIYLKCLKVIEQTTKTAMSPNATLREFSDNVKLLLERVSSPFERLTRITEMALYAASEPGKGLAAEASELANTLEKEISR